MSPAARSETVSAVGLDQLASLASLLGNVGSIFAHVLISRMT